ncbi:MAG: AAA family ATPase [Caldisericia bacterium]|nr:AAA family ATPase [Caldisericia bacterium]
MYIKEIIIKNFQSHKYTKIELSDKINVFLGKGNSGKSSIIRALIWVFFNEPQGTSFIRQNEQSAFVSITLDNGYKVIRERGVNVNKYVLVDPNGNKKEFSNFGRDVPDEIKKVIGMKTLPLENGKKLNPQIKDQMENIYLLDESPSTIHSTLLTISGGQVFDEAINSILVDLQRLDRKEKDIKKDIDEKVVLLKNYEGIDEKKESLIKIKNEIVSLKKIEERKNFLEKTKIELINIKRAQDIDLLELNSLKKVEPIEKDIIFLIDRKEKFMSLRNLKRDLENLKGDLEKISKDLEILKRHNLREELTSEIKLKIDRLNNLNYIKTSFLKLKGDINNLKIEYDEIQNKIDINIDEYFYLIFNNKVCPVCNREIDEDIKEKIKDNLNKMWR